MKALIRRSIKNTIKMRKKEEKDGLFDMEPPFIHFGLKKFKSDFESSDSMLIFFGILMYNKK